MKYSRVYTMILNKNYASEFYFKPYSLCKSQWCILPIVYTLRKKDIFLCEPRALAINICTVHHRAQPGAVDYGGCDYGGCDYGECDYGECEYGGCDYGKCDYGGCVSVRVWPMG